MGLADEDATQSEQVDDARHDLMDVFDVSEHVRCGDDLRLPVLLDDGLRSARAEERNDRRDAVFERDLRRVRRFDSTNAEACVFEVAEERTVVRADVDDEIVLLDADERSRLATELREVLAEDARRTARVRV